MPQLTWKQAPPSMGMATLTVCMCTYQLGSITKCLIAHAYLFLHVVDSRVQGEQAHFRNVCKFYMSVIYSDPRCIWSNSLRSATSIPIFLLISLIYLVTKNMRRPRDKSMTKGFPTHLAMCDVSISSNSFLHGISLQTKTVISNPSILSSKNLKAGGRKQSNVMLSHILSTNTQ